MHLFQPALLKHVMLMADMPIDQGIIQDRQLKKKSVKDGNKKFNPEKS
jgi:hypothetical protein